MRILSIIRYLAPKLAKSSVAAKLIWQRFWQQFAKLAKTPRNASLCAA
jgi:hypothetical protein